MSLALSIPIQGVPGGFFSALPVGLVEGAALFVDEVLELLSDLLEHATEVVVFESLATLLGQLLHDFAQTLDAIPVDIEALLEEIP